MGLLEAAEATETFYQCQLPCTEFRCPPARLLRITVVWIILFGSKFVILDIFNRVFGDRVLFTGPWHGVVAFIALVVAILAAEFLFGWVYRRLKLTAET